MANTGYFTTNALPRWRRKRIRDWKRCFMRWGWLLKPAEQGGTETRDRRQDNRTRKSAWRNWHANKEPIYQAEIIDLIDGFIVYWDMKHWRTTIPLAGLIKKTYPMRVRKGRVKLPGLSSAPKTWRSIGVERKTLAYLVVMNLSPRRLFIAFFYFLGGFRCHGIIKDCISLTYLPFLDTRVCVFYTNTQ